MRTSSLLAALALTAAAPRVAPVPDGPATPLPMQAHGRVEPVGGEEVRQWPGGYFETAFTGAGALFRVGAGDVKLHVLIDGREIATLVKPAPGSYRVDGLPPGRHLLRVEVASESQAGPTRFGGFFTDGAARAAPLPVRTRRIEFIGDSHTVGYGDTSPTRDCTPDQVWATTDTSQAFGPTLARRYGADYEVNAISGRGVVRNYDGFAADTLPEAYPYALFDKAQAADEPGWRPQVIVIALGANDFSTPLHAGEKWRTRDELHADYEASYLRFVRSLRARDPQALILLWATDVANGEVEAEVGRVAAALRAAGDARVAFVPVDGLAFSACHAHPALADEGVIAGKIAAAIDARPDAWTR